VLAFVFYGFHESSGTSLLLFGLASFRKPQNKKGFKSMKLFKYFSLPVVALCALVSNASAAAVDISSNVTTLISEIGTYVGYVIPVVFALVGIYFMFRIVRRTAK
jgi:ABC-type multidrug transport system permease subunit